MSKIDLEKLEDSQFDVLKEIGNIGAGNATTALATMLNIKLICQYLMLHYSHFDNISSFIGSEEQTVVGILLEIQGDIDGMMMFLFDMKSAHHLVNSLMMRDVHQDENGMADFSEMEMSALNEIGNIVSGSYLSALSGLTGMKMVSSVPALSIDMLGALLSVPAIEFGKYGDKLLMIQSEFGEDDFVTGYFLLIPELESYDKILTSLGM